MSTPIYKYRYYCVNETLWEEQWGETTPTLCKSGHTGIESIDIIETRKNNEVQIKEETVKTGGEYKFKGFPHVAPTGVSTLTIVWPYPIGILNSYVVADSTHIGDRLDLCIKPPVPIGALVAELPTGGTGPYLSPTVFDNSGIGNHLLLGSPTGHDMGEILSINEQGNQMFCQTGANTNYPPGTYIYMERHMVENLTFNAPGKYSAGKSKIGASYLPAGIPAYVKYTNNGTETKNITCVAEYLQ